MNKQTNQVWFKLVIVLIAISTAWFFGQRYSSLQKQHLRVIQETTRIQELVGKIQYELPTQQINATASQPYREDIVPYAAQIAGLKSSAVARIRPEEIKSETSGRTVRNTRVFLEKIDLASLLKMLIAIESNGGSTTVTSVTLEYSTRSDMWNSEFVFSSPINDE